LNGLKSFGKKELICNFDAILSPCTVKWLEENEEEKEVRTERGGGG